MKRHFYCLIVIVLGWFVQVACGAPQAEHVVLISIDGLRPDAIDEANTVALPVLMKEGSYCPKAKTVRPSLTLPAHVSMLTGLEVARHGVSWNDYKPGEISVPTIFSLVKKSGKSTAAFYTKPKFYFLARKADYDFLYIPPIPANWDSVNPLLVRAGVKASYAGLPDTSATGIANAFAREWPKLKPAFAFVHFRETDVAGHKYDWMSDDYLEAVGICDQAVGSILQTIDKSGLRSKTVVIVTTDHGGHGDRHDLDLPENNTIPWICSGPGVPKGIKIDREVRVTDTTPTALKLLGIPVPEKLDGKVVGELLKK